MNSVAELGSMPGADLDVVLAGLTDEELLGVLDDLNELAAANLGDLGSSRPVSILNAKRITRAQARARDHAVSRNFYNRSAPSGGGGVRYATMNRAGDVFHSTPTDPTLRFAYSTRGSGSPRAAIRAADAMRDQLFGLGEMDGEAWPEPAGIGEYVVELQGAGEPVAEIDGMGELAPAGDTAVFVPDNAGPLVATTIDALGHERTRRGRIDLDPGLGSWLSRTLRRNRRTLGAVTGVLGPVAAVTGVAAPAAAAAGILGPVLTPAARQGSAQPRQTSTVSFGGAPGVSLQLPTLDVPIPGGGRLVINPADILTGGGRQGSAPAPAPARTPAPAAPALRQGMTPQQQSQAMYRESRWRTMPGTFDPFGTRGQPAPASSPTVTLGPATPAPSGAPSDPGFAFGPGRSPGSWLFPGPRPTSPADGGSGGGRAPRGVVKVEDDVAARGGFADVLSSPVVVLGGLGLLALILSRK